MTRRPYRSIAFIVAGLALFLAANPAYAQGLATLDAILQAHHAWPVPPSSDIITGTSAKTGKSADFKITATNLEETIIESGDQKQVTTAKGIVFKDEGQKVQYSPVPSGFGQLDMTGVFFVAQLSRRAVQVDPPQKTTVQGAPGYRIRVSQERSQVHFGLSRVTDVCDLLVTEAGLLVGVSRLFYDDQPFRYTQTFVFGEYRETNKVLLPYQIQVLVKGRLTETIQISSYEFDVPTPTTLFEPRRSK